MERKTMGDKKPSAERGPMKTNQCPVILKRAQTTKEGNK
jgi:hypothetical protein